MDRSSFAFRLSQVEKDPLYLDPSQPVEKRVEHLLSLMSLEEKVVQRCQYAGMQQMKEATRYITPEEMQGSHMLGFYPDLPPDSLEERTRRGLVGSLLQVTTPGEAKIHKKISLISEQEQGYSINKVVLKPLFQTSISQLILSVSRVDCFRRTNIGTSTTVCTYIRIDGIDITF